MNEGPVLIHVWSVDPAQEPAAVERLDGMFGAIVTDPGFVSGRVLENADRTSMAAVVEMRSVADRQRIEQLPIVHDTLYHLHDTANIVVTLYNEIKTYS